MYYPNDLVIVLIPNVINNGYTYRLTAKADLGELVTVTVMNKKFFGVIIGRDNENTLAPEKIKPVLQTHGAKLPKTTLTWIEKMANWTMMPMGSVWKLMSSPADFAAAKKSSLKNYHDTNIITLSPEQQTAANAIKLDGFSATLLDGITGSGKTQVYFDAVLRAYNNDNQVLLMMPEIALTAQFSERFEKRFGAPPVIWHSNLTPAQRRDIWHGILAGDIKMIVGTRSALFLPWQNLGLIVVDEEHDTSYKQEEMGNYHARDMAVLMAKLGNFPIVLASATPSFETLYNVDIGKYSRLCLISRYGGASLPKIEIIDQRKKLEDS